jgi:hypothetical protein
MTTADAWSISATIASIIAACAGATALWMIYRQIVLANHQIGLAKGAMDIAKEELQAVKEQLNMDRVNVEFIKREMQYPELSLYAFLNVWPSERRFVDPQQVPIVFVVANTGQRASTNIHAYITLQFDFERFTPWQTLAQTPSSVRFVRFERDSTTGENLAEFEWSVEKLLAAGRLSISANLRPPVTASTVWVPRIRWVIYDNYGKHPAETDKGYGETTINVSERQW